MFVVLVVGVLVIMLIPIFVHIFLVGAGMITAIAVLIYISNHRTISPQEQRRRDLLGDDPEKW